MMSISELKSRTRDGSQNVVYKNRVSHVTWNPSTSMQRLFYCVTD